MRRSISSTPTVAPGTRAKGVTSFVVEKGDEGFTLGKKLPKLGSRCYPTGELFFTDCFVPEDRRIGEEGQGFYGVMRSFDRSRVTLAANSIGIGRAALEYAIDYAKQREAFGKKIHEFQAVSFRLVDAKMALDQARLLTLHAADLADAGEPFSTEASMAKLAASEAAWQAANAARDDPRLLRLLARIPRREVAARREAGGDLRGDQRHPAADHRPVDVPSCSIEFVLGSANLREWDDRVSLDVRRPQLLDAYAACLVRDGVAGTHAGPGCRGGGRHARTVSATTSGTARRCCARSVTTCVRATRRGSRTW